MEIVRILNLINVSYKRNVKSMTIYTNNTKIRPILDCLVSEGAISNYSFFEEGTSRCLSVKMKYYRSLPAIKSIKPQNKVYKTYAQSRYRLLRNDRLDLNLKIVSTTQGIMTNTQAKAKGLGGRLICSVF